MKQTITAVYEDGLLRPLQSLDLSEHESVQLKIIRREQFAPTRWKRSEYARAIRVLKQHGLIDTAKPLGRRRRVSEKRRRALAHALSVGKPLSEIIIEERDEKA